jgi:transposase InsO family protein
MSATYYDPPARDDTALVEAMFLITDECEAYGYRRLGAASRHQGLVVNHKKLRRLMRQHHLPPASAAPSSRRRTARTTGHFPGLDGGLVPCGPNQLWVGDITDVALGPLRLRRRHSRCVVTSGRMIRVGRTLDAAHDGGVAGRPGAPSAPARLHPPLGSWGTIRGRAVSPTLGGARPPWLDGPPRQSLRL